MRRVCVSVRQANNWQGTVTTLQAGTTSCGCNTSRHTTYGYSLPGGGICVICERPICEKPSEWATVSTVQVILHVHDTPTLYRCLGARLQHRHKASHVFWVLHRGALLSGKDRSHHHPTSRMKKSARGRAHLDRARGGEVVGGHQANGLVPQRRPDLRRALTPARLLHHQPR